MGKAKRITNARAHRLKVNAGPTENIDATVAEEILDVSLQNEKNGISEKSIFEKVGILWIDT